MQQFEFLIALRYLRSYKYSSRSKKRGGFLSFISLIAIVGIAISIWALIVVVSVMNGFQREVRQNLLGVVSHASVYNNTGSFNNWQESLSEISTKAKVIAAAPFIEKQGLITINGNVRAVAVRGIDPKLEPQVAEFLQKPVNGDVSLLEAKSFRVMIGVNLAQNLGLRLGDSFTLIAPQGDFSPIGLVPRLRRFEIVGIFKANLYEFDAGMVLINYEDAQTLFQVKNIDGIRLRFDDVLKAHIYVRDLNKNLSNNLFAQDWSASHSSYFRAVQIEKRMMFLILSIIIGVAAINVINQQMMLITEKTGDIAILRTLGAGKLAIVRIFLLQGFLLSTLGIVLGVVSGVITALNVEVIMRTIESILQIKFLAADVYQIPEIPSQLQMADVLVTAGVSFLVTTLATIYPSFRASKTLPAEALRYE